jgi:hypothetical protein
VHSRFGHADVHIPGSGDGGQAQAVLEPDEPPELPGAEPPPALGPLPGALVPLLPVGPVPFPGLVEPVLGPPFALPCPTELLFEPPLPGPPAPLSLAPGLTTEPPQARETAERLTTRRVRALSLLMNDVSGRDEQVW